MLAIVPFVASISACGENEPKEEPRSVARENISAGENGKKLFYAHCASCHMVNNEMTGPALKGVRSRWPDNELLYAFIRNSSEVIDKNTYARELWLEWNQTVMPPQPAITNADIEDILGYIESVSQ